MVGDDDALLDEVVERVEDVGGLPLSQVVGALRPVVTDLMLATHVDGSWPDASLTREALSIALEAADAAVADQGAPAESLTPDDVRWLEACRSACRSVELLDDMLDDLRRGSRPLGPPVRGA